MTSENSPTVVDQPELAHVECPQCGKMGDVMNQPGTTQIGVIDSDIVEVCYTGDSVIMHDC